MARDQVMAGLLIRLTQNGPGAGVPLRPDLDALLAGVAPAAAPPADEVTDIFDDYFARDAAGRRVLDGERHALLYALAVPPQFVRRSRDPNPAALANARPLPPLPVARPGPAAAPRPRRAPAPAPAPVPPWGPLPYLRRMTIADLAWLYFFDRFGLFEMIGAVADDYDSGGRFPIVRGSLHATVLQQMIAAVRMGMSPKGDARRAAYERCLGWCLPSTIQPATPTSTGAAPQPPAKQQQDGSAGPNAMFRTNFEDLLRAMLGYYRDRNFAQVMQGKNAGTAPAAMLATIGSLGRTVKSALDPFKYGAAYDTTVDGIVWAVASLSVLRDVRGELGIPMTRALPEHYLTAAYDLLVLKRLTPGPMSDRFSLHLDCANHARAILLTLETLDAMATGDGGEVETWIELMQPIVEGFANAYLRVAKVDLRPPVQAVLDTSRRMGREESRTGSPSAG
jgi:hypothetical protein